MVQSPKSPASEAHILVLAAARHHAAAHHHHQAAYHRDLGKPEDAKKHADAALEHSKAAHVSFPKS